MILKPCPTVGFISTGSPCRQGCLGCQRHWQPLQPAPQGCRGRACIILRHSTACTRALGSALVSDLMAARRSVLYCTLALLMVPVSRPRALRRHNGSRRLAPSTQGRRAALASSHRGALMAKRKRLADKHTKRKTGRPDRDSSAGAKGKRRRQEPSTPAAEQGPPAGRDRFKERLQEASLAYFAEVSDRLESLEDEEEKGLLATRWAGQLRRPPALAPGRLLTQSLPAVRCRRQPRTQKSAAGTPPAAASWSACAPVPRTRASQNWPWPWSRWTPG